MRCNGTVGYEQTIRENNAPFTAPDKGEFIDKRKKMYK
jgi:hypothetical protein